MWLIDNSKKLSWNIYDHDMIKAISHALPSCDITHNDLIARFGEAEIASIYKMSGIQNCKVVAQGQTAADLGYAAAKKIFEETSTQSRLIF